MPNRMIIRRLFQRSLLLSALLTLSACSDVSSVDDQIQNVAFLLDLPANQWVEYHEIASGAWWRKSHAGMAYDSKRQSLLIFGSDTHGEDWDNVVHEFMINQRRWVQHGKYNPKDSYRLDPNGHPVAGDENIAPWAMHTYDGVEYDPIRDALIIAGSPDHNPVKVEQRHKAVHPLWQYQLAKKTWTPLPQNEESPRGLFGAAATYDELNERIIICKSGIWALDAQNNNLEKISDAPNCLHRTMVMDTVRHKLYLFGAYRATTDIMRRDMLSIDDASIGWEKVTPGGYAPPPYDASPAAFDKNQGVFLLVAEHSTKEANTVGETVKTFVYDPDANSYTELKDARLPQLGMNFMMTWDKVNGVFFLVTGNWKSGATVWALRLRRDTRTGRFD
jgi:hypothetical protein